MIRKATVAYTTEGGLIDPGFEAVLASLMKEYGLVKKDTVLHFASNEVTYYYGKE